MEKINLLNLPTRIHEVTIDHRNHYYFKRDDETGFALGGNKTRKIEYFMKEIMDQGCDYVLTYGSLNSNHCRVVSAAAARFGLGCGIVTVGTEKEISFQGNDLMNSFAGCEYYFVDSVSKVGSTIDKTMNLLRSLGMKPYFIPGGGHGNCGTQAYVDAYKEILEFEQQSGIRMDYIFFSSGTGTTQAGLVAGKKLYGGEGRIVGISISRTTKHGIKPIFDSVNENLEPHGMQIGIDEIEFVDAFICGGYGKFDDDVVCTIRDVYRMNSCVLDPVYTGKAVTGMKKYLASHDVSDKNILFIHTGGTPVFFSMGNELNEVRTSIHTIEDGKINA